MLDREARALGQTEGLSELLDLLGTVRLAMVPTPPGKRGGLPRGTWQLEQAEPEALRLRRHLVPDKARSCTRAGQRDPRHPPDLRRQDRAVFSGTLGEGAASVRLIHPIDGFFIRPRAGVTELLSLANVVFEKFVLPWSSPAPRSDQVLYSLDRVH